MSCAASKRAEVNSRNRFGSGTEVLSPLGTPHPDEDKLDHSSREVSSLQLRDFRFCQTKEKKANSDQGIVHHGFFFKGCNQGIKCKFLRL